MSTIKKVLATSKQPLMVAMNVGEQFKDQIVAAYKDNDGNKFIINACESPVSPVTGGSAKKISTNYSLQAKELGKLKVVACCKKCSTNILAVQDVAANLSGKGRCLVCSSSVVFADMENDEDMDSPYMDDDMADVEDPYADEDDVEDAINTEGDYPDTNYEMSEDDAEEAIKNAQDLDFLTQSKPDSDEDEDEDMDADWLSQLPKDIQVNVAEDDGSYEDKKEDKDADEKKDADGDYDGDEPSDDYGDEDGEDDDSGDSDENAGADKDDDAEDDDKSEDKEEAHITYKTFAGTTLEKDCITLARANASTYYVFANDEPIFTLKHEQASKEVQELWNNRSSMTAAFVTSAENINEDVLANFGATPVVVSFEIEKARAQEIVEATTAATEQVTAKLESIKEDFNQSIAIASVGIDKQAFGKEFSNPLLASLIKKLTLSGIRNPEGLVMSAFIESGKEYQKLVVAKALELMENTPEVRNAIATQVNLAPYATIASLESQELTNKLIASNTLIDDDDSDDVVASVKEPKTTEFDRARIKRIFSRL